MIFEVFLLILAIPAGFFIAWLAQDELKQGREWFRLLTIISLALGSLFWIYGISYIALTLSFIAIVSLISFIKKKR